MRPLEVGGLGIHNLEVMGWALQMRWLWIAKTKPDRRCAGLEIPVHLNTSAMFAISDLITGYMDRAWKIYHLMYTNVSPKKCEEQGTWLRPFIS